MDLRQRPVVVAQQPQRDLPHPFAQRGQVALAVGLEQRRAELRLDPLERHRHRRGRPVQPLCRIGDVAAFGHGDEGAQGLDAHRVQPR